MIDFTSHASLFAPLWLEEQPALKPLNYLAISIPSGYFSFLVFTILIGWIYGQIFEVNISLKNSALFGIKLGGLYAVSGFFGQFSFLNLPALYLLMFNIVLFTEIVAVSEVYGYLMHSESIKKKIITLLFIFFGGLVLGVVIQNITGVYQQI